jgi:hypothetical protein
MTAQDYVDLTPEQQKAWDRLAKAVKDFRKAGGDFYVVLQSMHGFNGKHIHCVQGEGDPTHQCEYFSTGSVDLPVIYQNGFCSFADDPHEFVLKPGKHIVEV